jgi:hypothetical protein
MGGHAINPQWHAVALGLRPKLAVTTSDDASEREANRVADAIVSNTSFLPIASRAAPYSIAHECAAFSTASTPCDSCEDRDFRDVRVHADSRAAVSARSIGARAYTCGTQIAFARGEFTAIVALHRHRSK